MIERGHPIAMTKPIKQEDARQAALQAMVDKGLIRQAGARKGLTTAPLWRPVKVKGKPLSQTIIEDREDRA